MILRKLSKPHIWRRIGVERLTEPIHLNVASLLVAMFGSYRAKIAFDVVVRQHTAFCLLRCADYARSYGIKTITAVEFGVAAGTGLLNMARIASRVTEITGVQFNIVGFDTGRGMPSPIDYRDHPDLYSPGDFPMDEVKLRKALPGNIELIVGELRDTAPDFIRKLSPSAPIGYVCVDVDFYSSTKDALTLLAGPPELYLPETYVYLDDLEDNAHNSNCGELLAVSEFNAERSPRIIERPRFLRGYRIMKNARWIDHIFIYHVVDHPVKGRHSNRGRVDLPNPYLSA
jgi:hypothetical protein